MKNLAVSRRYAKALILIGQEDGQAEQYNEELSAIAGLFDTQEGFEQALINPLINKNDRKKLLVPPFHLKIRTNLWTNI